MLRLDLGGQDGNSVDGFLIQLYDILCIKRTLHLPTQFLIACH